MLKILAVCSAYLKDLEPINDLKVCSFVSCLSGFPCIGIDDYFQKK